MELNNKYIHNWAKPVHLSIVGAYAHKVPTLELPSGRVVNYVHTKMDAFHFRKDYKTWSSARRWAEYWEKKLKDNGAYWGTLSIYDDGHEVGWDL